MNQKLKAVKNACIAANPQIDKDEARGIIFGRPIRLADVLLAMTRVLNGEEAQRPVLELIDDWNLRADDLEKQSEETINFLYDLLAPQHPDYGKDCPECGGYERNHRTNCAAVE
jgi:hypothetical protein